MLQKQRLIERVVTAARTEETVLALWECGSVAFNRSDEYSDIDLDVVVAVGQIETVAEVIRYALSSLAKISNECRQRTYHGDTQIFWLLEGFPTFNFVDCSLIERREGGVRIDPGMVGEPVIHFDKCGCLTVTEETPEDRDMRVKQRLEEIAQVAAIHPVIVEKHIRRGHTLSAYGEYQKMLIRPLIELLRIKHCPQRSSWQTTYIEWDLPTEVNARLLPLVMVDSLEQMEKNLAVIQAWVEEMIQELFGS